jgi:hypothetical protein
LTFLNNDYQSFKLIFIDNFSSSDVKSNTGGTFSKKGHDSAVGTEFIIVFGHKSIATDEYPEK